MSNIKAKEFVPTIEEVRQNHCGICFHYRQQGMDLNMGDCARFPPAVFPLGNGTKVSLFPPVKKAQTACGEFKSTIVMN